jgi:predicted DCC family thiol-disulfide oxidoreductase YuxK
VEGQKHILIFDDSCPLCRKSVDWIVKRTGEDRLHLIPCDSEERRNNHPEIGDEECSFAIQLVTPEGKDLAGDRAILEILSLNGRLSGLALLWKVPVLGSLLARTYRWVAMNRHRISALFRKSPKN